MQIKTALISVYDKTGIVELAKRLQGVKILSTGGTAKLLKENGIDVVDVSEYTSSKEILDGRVKTLHPKIYAGLLARRDVKEHMDELVKQEIDPIDLVVVNLYPFEETVAKNPSLQEAVEKIDIGGPTMIRAAAKNFVPVVVDPTDYSKIDIHISKDVIESLVVKAFSRVADYDSAIEKYLGKELENKNYFRASFVEGTEMRYGENPHQEAMFFKGKDVKETSIGYGKQLHGKQISYNNILDTDSALEITKEFKEPTVAIIKHLNPCGVASGLTIKEAYVKALECDPLSAFGSVVSMNRECDEETALEISKVFTEVLICPSFTPEALDILTQKKNIRLIETGDYVKDESGFELRTVVGGILKQSRKYPDLKWEDLKKVSKTEVSEELFEDIMFAHKINRYVKSNAIVLVKDKVMVGVGTGQTSRVKAVQLAIEKAGKKAEGAVLSSDAFFPFRDGIDEAAKGKVGIIVQPGGSVRDDEVIAAADEHGIGMVFTGVRLFRH